MYDRRSCDFDVLLFMLYNEDSYPGEIGTTQNAEYTV